MAAKRKIESINKETPDLAKDAVERLKDLFPEAVAEGKSSKGTLSRYQVNRIFHAMLPPHLDGQGNSLLRNPETLRQDLSTDPQLLCRPISQQTFGLCDCIPSPFSIEVSGGNPDLRATAINDLFKRPPVSFQTFF